MSLPDHLAVLVEQLDTLLAAEPGAGEALEVASLAGLLAREQPDHPAVQRAESWADGPGAALLAEALPRLDAEGIVGGIEDVDPTDEYEERSEPLLRLDEATAALYWMGAEATVRGLVDAVLPLLPASPEIWVDFVPAATRVLSDAAPGCADPGLEVWRTIEAAEWYRDAPVPEAPPAAKARLALGLGVRIPPAANQERPDARLAAASDEEIPPSDLLLEENGVKLFVETPSEGPRRVVIIAKAGSAVSLGTLELRQDAPGEWSAEMTEGTHELVVNDKRWPIFVE